ncbi:hypothetical protein CRM22_008012 [Opisthorchis felineus]|uniref:Uncharacterized protein n=1 Tax=Opisthorchis felineus TaxID=147828 RepID=A0A4S2LLH8_OPIFE|nr:hypothetical protein CRM22_008012 [Opisthorchis felineus]
MACLRMTCALFSAAMNVRLNDLQKTFDQNFQYTPVFSHQNHYPRIDVACNEHDLTGIDISLRISLTIPSCGNMSLPNPKLKDQISVHVNHSSAVFLYNSHLW